MLELGQRLGPVLWQLPDTLKFDPAAVAEFLAQLDPVARHAIEVRHESFRTNEFYELARQHNVAVVYSDGAGKWPVFDVPTADFSYIRLHGGEELYISGYDDRELTA